MDIFSGRILKQCISSFGQTCKTLEMADKYKFIRAVRSDRVHICGGTCSILKTFVERFPFAHLAIVLTIALLLAFIPPNCHEKKFVPNTGNAIGSIVLLVWSIVSLSGLTTFLYFNF